MNELVVKDLNLKISEQVEIRADFMVAPGERLALHGRSGSGKTSVLKAIAGLIESDQGSIYLGSRDLRSVSIEKRNIGFVFQKPALFPSLNVSENLSFGLRMRGVSASERKKEAVRWLIKLGMPEKEDETIDHLSGGEAQRLALGRALIIKPDLLLLDEPLSALGKDLKISLRKLILELHLERPVPLVFVTHDEADLQALATQVIGVKEKGPVREFQTQ